MTLSPFIASVDPGLDGTAVAFFDLRRWEPVAGHTLAREQRMALVDHAAVKALVNRAEEIATSPAEPLPDRLLFLHAEAHAIAAGPAAPGIVYLEMPAIEGGGYGAMRTRRGVGRNVAAVGKLHMAIGALVAGFAGGGARVVPFPAPVISKDKKHLVVKALLSGSPLWELCVGPNGGQKQDFMDALFNGLHVLADPALRPPPWRRPP